MGGTLSKLAQKFMKCEPEETYVHLRHRPGAGPTEIANLMAGAIMGDEIAQANVAGLVVCNNLLICSCAVHSSEHQQNVFSARRWPSDRRWRDWTGLPSANITTTRPPVCGEGANQPARSGRAGGTKAARLNFCSRLPLSPSPET